MPLPLGHIAIGLTTNDLLSRNSSFGSWRVALCVAILANLPDVDFAVGLLLQGNGSVFHRGPTHSVLFAFLAGLMAANAWRIWCQIPKLGFGASFSIVLSHVLSDLFITESPVSLLCPLEIHWSVGYSGWREVLSPIFLEAYRDAGILLVCLAVMIIRRLIGQVRQYLVVGSFAYRWSSLRQNPHKE